jgi:pimeloyl-ACP methyl ester carboxylesterase
VNVLLLHAWPLDGSMWEPQLEPLRAAGHEPIAPHLYGRGASIDGWAAQLLGEVEGPFVAVGASMGGYCSLALARRASERVPGLVLVGSRADADSAERREFRDRMIAVLRRKGVPDDVPETDVAPEDLAVAQEAIRDRPDLTSVASSFGGPLLVCVGEGDDIVPVEVARDTAAGALLGSLEVFAGAGHLLSVEQPERFTEVVLEFLTQWT